MLHNKFVNFSLLLLIFNFGCSTSKSVSKFKNDILSQSNTNDSTILDFWEPMVSKRIKDFEKYDCPLTASELKKAAFIKLKVYLLDSASFFNISKENEIAPKLQLQENLGCFFVKKDSCLVALLQPKYENNAWINDAGWGVLSKQKSEDLYLPLIRSGNPFFLLLISRYNQSNRIQSKNVITFIENNKFYIFDEKNLKVKLFDYLISRKEYILNNPKTFGW